MTQAIPSPWFEIVLAIGIALFVLGYLWVSGQLKK